MCISRQRETREELSGQPVPMPRNKKRLSCSSLDDSKSQVVALKQDRKPTTSPSQEVRLRLLTCIFVYEQLIK